ncbi:MAG: S8 family peptidase [Muribaculaceae bacterium]|nr:S8 family peptidase [Muribaculaceae bacterium]
MWFLVGMGKGMTPCDIHSAQDKSKLTADVKRVLAEHTLLGRGGETVKALVWLDDDANLDDADVRVLARCGRLCTIELPADSVVALGERVEVNMVAMPRRLHLHNDSARSKTGVEWIQQGIDLPASYDGSGVVVGVVDVGIDYGHLAFRDASGNTRVGRVYMPCREGTGKVIAGEMELPGTEYAGDEILTLVTDETTQSHGTHTSGIAAGSRVNCYGGMAPGSELVLCEIPLDSLTDENVIYSVWYVAQYAKQAGKPCVINLSMGNHDGPHDGTGLMARALDEVSETTGAIIVLSAGNEGADNLYIHKEFTDDDTVLYSFLTAVNGSIDTQVDAWSGDATPIAVRYSLYSRDRGYLSRTDWLMADTLLDYNVAPLHINGVTGTIDVRRAVNALTGKREVLTTAKLQMLGVYLQIGFKGLDGKEIDVWSCDGQDLKSLGVDSCMSGNPSCSISDMATGQNTVSVGAYVSRSTYPLVDGGEHPTSGVMGYRSYFSSYGVDKAGHQHPLVLAPGQMVVSALNRYQEGLSRNVVTAEEIDNEGNAHWWGAKSGTSMSAPVVSGIVALWLEANPNLTVADVKRVIRSTAMRDHYVEAEPECCGAGKIDAHAGLQAVLSTSIKDVKNDISNLDVTYMESSRSMHVRGCGASRLSIEVYSMQGQCVSKMTLPTFDGSADVLVPELAAGAYVIRVMTPDTIVTRKIMVR